MKNDLASITEAFWFEENCKIVIQVRRKMEKYGKRRDRFLAKIPSGCLGILL